MSRLSDVISQIVAEERDSAGRIEIHHAVAAARNRIDDEDRNTLVDEALGNRIKAAALKGRKHAEKAIGNQVSMVFPGLRDAHSIDIDGRIVKQTDQMSELEFKRVLEIRRKQILYDRAYFKILENAYNDVRPFWASSPDKTFGEVCQLFETMSKKPVAGGKR